MKHTFTNNPRGLQPPSLGTIYTVRVVAVSPTLGRLEFTVEDTMPDGYVLTSNFGPQVVIESVTVLARRPATPPPPPPPAPRDPLAPRLVRRA